MKQDKPQPYLCLATCNRNGNRTLGVARCMIILNPPSQRKMNAIQDNIQ